jgi:hypothetical protein
MDVSKEVEPGEILLDLQDNNLNSGVSIGGTKLMSLGKTMTCIVCMSPIQATNMCYLDRCKND